MNFRRLKHCQFLHCLCQCFLFGCLSFLLQFSGFVHESTHELLRLFIVGDVELFTLPSDLFCLLESSFVLPARQRVPQTLLLHLHSQPFVFTDFEAGPVFEAAGLIGGDNKRKVAVSFAWWTEVVVNALAVPLCHLLFFLFFIFFDRLNKRLEEPPIPVCSLRVVCRRHFCLDWTFQLMLILLYSCFL